MYGGGGGGWGSLGSRAGPVGLARGPSPSREALQGLCTDCAMSLPILGHFWGQGRGREGEGEEGALASPCCGGAKPDLART